MDQNPETSNIPGGTEMPAAEEIIDVQATQVGEPVSVPMSPPSYAEPPKKNNNAGWIIALVLLVVLCCCCLVIFIVALNLLGGVFSWAYQTIIGILNSIFGGSIRIY